MDGECINCGESGNWCSCEEKEQTMNTTKKLPDKPSALIRLALEDLKKVEQDDNYIVNMNQWHMPIVGYKCQVCLAGAVMVKEFDAPRDEFLTPGSYEITPPDDLEAHNYNRLCSLNEFRQGMIKSGFLNLGLELPQGLPRAIVVTDYEHSPRKFYEDMEAMAKLLEEHGY